MKNSRSEFTANASLARAPEQPTARDIARGNGWAVGQHAFAPMPARAMRTRPTMMQRFMRAVYRAI